MKVFVQRSEDGLFLKTEAIWVSRKSDAREFDHCTPAINFCVEQGVTNVRLLLSFGDSRYDLTLEVFRRETQKPTKASRVVRSGEGMPQSLLKAGSRERRKPFLLPPLPEATAEHRTCL